MKRILVPTDFSACANTAAVTAIKLAQQLKAEVFYLNLCKEPVVITHIPGVHHELPSEEVKFARNELAQLVTMTELQGIKATPVLAFDNGLEKIENYIQPYGIDLVVMGSHGSDGIKEFVFGSNTQHVVSHVDVPVLVVKNDLGFNSLSNILFISDFNRIPINEFAVVADIANIYQATVHLIYVNFIDEPVSTELAQDRMKQLANEYPGINFSYNIAETNDEEYAIAQFAKQLGADLVSLTISSTNSHRKVTSQTSTEHIVNHEQKPVLVIKS